MKLGFASLLLGEFPGLFVVDENVGGIGERHHFTQRPTEFPFLIGLGNRRRRVA